LGDTTFGECCVDEVAAEHTGADSVIHFGEACLTPTDRLPVLHIFTDVDPDAESMLSTLESTSDIENVVVFYDLRYSKVGQH